MFAEVRGGCCQSGALLAGSGSGSGSASFHPLGLCGRNDDVELAKEIHERRPCRTDAGTVTVTVTVTATITN